MAHRGLREPKGSREVGNARLTVLGRLNQTQQTQSGRVSKRLEDASKSLGVGAVNRLASKRRDLGQGHLSQRSSHVFHPSTNSIDPPAYPQVRIDKFSSPIG